MEVKGATKKKNANRKKGELNRKHAVLKQFSSSDSPVLSLPKSSCKLLWKSKMIVYENGLKSDIIVPHDLRFRYFRIRTASRARNFALFLRMSPHHYLDYRCHTSELSIATQRQAGSFWLPQWGAPEQEAGRPGGICYKFKTRNSKP